MVSNITKKEMLEKYKITISLCFIFIVFVLRFYIGSEPMIVGWDAGIMIDGGYRVYHGQLPHVDFTTPLGPITFWLVGIAMHLFGLNISAIDYGILLMGFILITIYIIFFKHLNSSLYYLIFFYFLSYIITPRIYSYPPWALGYTSIYNLLGYNLLFLIFLLLFMSHKNDNNQKIALIIAAFFVVITIFTKITYGIVAICFTLIYFMKNARKNVFFLLFVGYVIGFMIFAIIYHGNFKVIIDNIAISIVSNKQTLEHRLLNFLNFKFMLEILLFVFLYLNLKRYIKDNFFSVFVIALALFLMLGNGQEAKEIAFTSWLAILYITAITYKQINVKIPKLAYVFVFIPMIINFSSLAYALSIKIDEGTCFGKVIKQDCFVQNERLTFLAPRNEDNIICSSIKLLEPHFTKNDKIISPDFTNYFSFLFKVSPPNGDLLWWHENMTFSREAVSRYKNYFEASRVLKDVTFILIGKTKVCQSGLFEEMYDSYIHKNFEKIDENEFFMLYKRII